METTIIQDVREWSEAMMRSNIDISMGKSPQLPILKSGDIVRNLENNFVGTSSTMCKVKITPHEIVDEVHYWIPLIVGYVAGANPHVSVFEGFARRIWKDDIDKIGMIAHGVFIIKFKNVEMRDKALDGGFIFFDRKPFIMKAWNATEIFNKKSIDNVPTWVQILGLELKYTGGNSMYKILEQIGKPLQMDLSTQRRDKLMYPRVLIKVRLRQEFPDHIWFLNELDQEVMLGIKYERLLKICKHCNGIGHDTEECRNNKQTTKVWNPKQKQETKKPTVDEEGFQAVNNGKKVQLAHREEVVNVKNGFLVLQHHEQQSEEKNTEQHGEEKKTGREGEPSDANG